MDIRITWHRPLMLFSVAMVGLAAVAAVGLIVDDRTLLGAPIWLKPLKFAISLGFYSVTWAWLISRHPRHPRWLHRTGTVLAAVGVVEMTIIVGQVVRGRRSHFNTETAFDAMLFQIMGVSIAVLWVATLISSISVVRAKIGPRSLDTAILIGTAGSLVGMLTGVLMSQQRTGIKGTDGAHAVGVPDGGPGMPITGWSLEAGDLRVGHFVGIHALQVLPLLAMALIALAGRYAALADDAVRTRLVWTAGLVYVGLFGVVTWQALRGQSVVSPDAITVALYGLLAVAAVGGTASALGRRKVAA